MKTIERISLNAPCFLFLKIENFFLIVKHFFFLFLNVSHNRKLLVKAATEHKVFVFNCYKVLNLVMFFIMVSVFSPVNWGGFPLLFVTILTKLLHFFFKWTWGY